MFQKSSLGLHRYYHKVRSVEFVNEFVFKLSVLEDEILFNCEGSVRFKDIFSWNIYIIHVICMIGHIYQITVFVVNPIPVNEILINEKKFNSP